MSTKLLTKIVYHFDFYRLKVETEALDMGVDDYLYSIGALSMGRTDSEFDSEVMIRITEQNRWKTF
jgi:tRNA A37 threonylcarbamoyladenosine biosynthesis protein TsaE